MSVLEGYADVVVETIGDGWCASYERIDEATAAATASSGARRAAFVDRLLGLELERQHYETGAAFCRGVIERAGLDGLNRLWEGRADGAHAGRARGARAVARPHRPARRLKIPGGRDADRSARCGRHGWRASPR